MTSQAHCKGCGHFLSRDDQSKKDGYCQKCRLSILSGHKNSNKKMEEKKMSTMSNTQKWVIGIIVGLVILTVGIPTLIAGGRFVTNSVIIPVWNWGLGVKATTQNNAAVDTPKTAASNATAPAVPAATSAPAVIDSNADTTGMVTEQNYVPHPRRYEETGIEGTKTWENLVVNDDEYLVVGGVIVNGIKDGVYQGYGPGTYTVTVTNGFISVVDDDWGDEEFDFRVDQAIQYGWAHAHLSRGVIPN